MFDRLLDYLHYTALNGIMCLTEWYRDKYINPAKDEFNRLQELIEKAPEDNGLVEKIVKKG